MRAIPAPTDAQYKYYLAQCLNKQGFESVALANKVLKTRKIATARQVYKCRILREVAPGTLPPVLDILNLIKRKIKMLRSLILIGLCLTGCTILILRA